MPLTWSKLTVAAVLLAQSSSRPQTGPFVATLSFTAASMNMLLDAPDLDLHSLATERRSWPLPS